MTPDGARLPRRQLAGHDARSPRSSGCTTVAGGEWADGPDPLVGPLARPAPPGRRPAGAAHRRAGRLGRRPRLDDRQPVPARPRRAGAAPADGAIAVDGGDFPTDRYVVDGIAAATGRDGARRRSTTSTTSPSSCARSVDYRTADVADIAAETARATPPARSRSGTCRTPPAPSRSTSTAAGVDLAVGCTYKFLHGGPGAPAWSYVRAASCRRDRPADLGLVRPGATSSRWATRYEPHPDVRRLLLGTPGILGLATAEVGIGHVADAGMAAIAAKGRALTGLALDAAAPSSASTRRRRATRRGAAPTSPCASPTPTPSTPR